MNEMFSQGGKGSVGILTNKQAVARHFGVKQSEVVYYKVGADLGGYKVIYDKDSQRAYSIPAYPTGTTVISLSASALLTHSAGSIELGDLAVSRGEFVTLQGTFTTGATINVRNERLTHEGKQYYWAGALPKVVAANSTPETAGGIGSDAWVIEKVYAPTEYTYATLAEALDAEIPVGSKVTIGTKTYSVADSTDLSPATAPVITMSQGTLLKPVSGFIRKEVGQTVTISTITEVAAQFNLITDRSVQGVSIDSVSNKILFAVNVLSSENAAEGGIFYEYEFNRETGKVGAFLRTFSGIPSGHTDYFTVVHTATGRKLLFTEPSGNVWTSGYYVSAVDLDAANPSATKTRLIDFTADGTRALVSVWNNDLIIQRVGRTVARCKVTDVLAGIYNPLEIYGWGYLLNMVGSIIPEQNLQKHPEGNVFWGLSGYDSRYKNHSCIASGEGGVNTSATFFDHTTQYELEAVCFYWRDSDHTYHPYIVLQDIAGHNLAYADVESSLSTSQAIWRKQSFTATTYQQWEGSSSYMYCPMPVAVNGLAIGGHSLGVVDSYNPTDLTIDQWANNATRRSSRIQFKASDSTKNNQFLMDEARDTVYGQGFRFSLNDGTKTWQSLQIKPGKVLIGVFEQVSSANYYGKVNIVNGDADDRVGIYLNSSTTKPQLVSGATAPTMASTANNLSYGSWNSGTSAYTEWLKITSAGYTWSVPASSARELKKDFDYDGVKGLEVVRKLKPLLYTFKNDNARRAGFIADESYDADEYLAHVDEDGKATGIWEQAHIAQLVKAVQQLDESVQALQKENNDLKEKLKSLGN